MTKLTRRHWLGAMAGVGVVLLLKGRMTMAEEKDFPFTLTDAAWRQKLTGEQYAVLRAHGTEPPMSSPLNQEKRAGIYHCAGCRQPLFEAKTKFDSGTGWPSFWDHLPAAVGTTTDYKLIAPRTEVHCSNCGGHLGHVFADGPPPTGLRYCMNGVCLTFVPQI